MCDKIEAIECESDTHPFIMDVQQRQLDMFCYIEEMNLRPPVAALTIEDLKRWAEKNELSLKCFDKSGIYVYNDTTKKNHSNITYQQFWVKNNKCNYRKIYNKAFESRKVDGSTFEQFDVDHVIARSRVKKIAEKQEMWLAVFPVKSSWNRFFGPHEKKETSLLSEKDFSDGIYFATGLEILKVCLQNIYPMVKAAQNRFAPLRGEDTALITEIKEEMRKCIHI